MVELIGFIGYLIHLYMYIIFASVIMSWLIGFGVINLYNPIVRSLYDALLAVTEPFLRPIRNVLPNLGAIDISPFVLILICLFILQVLIPNLLKIFI